MDIRRKGFYWLTRQRILGMHANAHLKAERSHDRKGVALLDVQHSPWFLIGLIKWRSCFPNTSSAQRVINAHRKKEVQRRANICVANGVFTRDLLRIHLSDRYHVTYLRAYAPRRFSQRTMVIEMLSVEICWKILQGSRAEAPSGASSGTFICASADGVLQQTESFLTKSTTEVWFRIHKETLQSKQGNVQE